MKITVSGIGYVGLVTGVCLAELGHEVTCIDIHEEKIEMLSTGQSPIYEPGLEALLEKNLTNGQLHFTTNPEVAYSTADIIFIAVGTPENQDGTVNLEFIHTVAQTIAHYSKQDMIICIKSTVPVGTNEQIQKIIEQYKDPQLNIEVVSNPEFLREGSAIHDFFHADRIVIGSENLETALLIEVVYKPLNIPIIKTDLRSAEMIKYASNAFLATKISFINEIATLCEKIGANIDEVKNAIGKDHRIGPYFLQAGIGYGGSCFPKDTKALIQLAGNLQHEFDLLKAVIEVNQQQRSLPVRKAKELCGNLQNKKVAILGIAFKPNTDDIREAAAIPIIKELLKEGANITAFDPIAIPNARQVLGEGILYTENIKDALFDADVAIIATEWDVIKTLPLNKFQDYMKTAIVIDGRNCYPLEEVQKHALTYVSVGRPAVMNHTNYLTYGGRT